MALIASLSPWPTPRGTLLTGRVPLPQADKRGKTPLDYAELHERWNVIELLKRGPEVDLYAQTQAAAEDAMSANGSVAASSAAG